MNEKSNWFAIGCIHTKTFLSLNEGGVGVCSPHARVGSLQVHHLPPTDVGWIFYLHFSVKTGMVPFYGDVCSYTFSTDHSTYSSQPSV